MPGARDPVNEVKTTLEAADLRDLILTYREGLRSHQQVINLENVYPVPDGDTGTNMALTVDAVVRELDALDRTAQMDDVCRAVAHGSLMGARGNSGIILSQLLRGIADRAAQLREVGGPDVAEALVSASELARQAVVRPVDGTILTVADAAAAGAVRANAEGAGLVGVAREARRSAAEALDRTPQLLEVLAKAGVVDAGGAGYLLFFDALLHVVDGQPMPEPPAVEAVDRAKRSAPSRAGAASDRGGFEERAGSAPSATASETSGAQPGPHPELDLRYEVMYLLHAPDDTIPAFKEVWAGIGDSIVVVGRDGVWNCHIHTNDIGAAVEASLDAGRPSDIRVTDLSEQVDEEHWVRESAVDVAHDEPSGSTPTTDVVAVVTGEGIGRIFRSLGVHRHVHGGQTFNPSTEELLEAVEGVGADQVVILPNNKNIVPVAQQVDRLSSKQVRVVPTRSIVQGFAALLAYDPAAGVVDNEKGMIESAQRVVSAEVTQAVRDAPTDVGDVKLGDWIGLTQDGVLAIGSSLADATCGLLQRLLESDHELVTLIEGSGATAGDTRRVTEWLREEHGEVAVEVHHGGQPLYAYLIGIE